MIEYRGAAFGGALDHKLLVVRYSAGDDIVALKVAADGSVTQAAAVPGMSGLNDPVDLVEDPATGNLYVSELGARRITLLRVHNAVSSTAAAALVASDSGPAGPVEPPVDPGTTPEPPAAWNPPNAPATPPALPLKVPLGSNERRFIRRIERFVRRHWLTVPDIARADQRTLRMILAGLRIQAGHARISRTIRPLTSVRR